MGADFQCVEVFSVEFVFKRNTFSLDTENQNHTLLSTLTWFCLTSLSSLAWLCHYFTVFISMTLFFQGSSIQKVVWLFIIGTYRKSYEPFSRKYQQAIHFALRFFDFLTSKCSSSHLSILDYRIMILTQS